MTITWAIDRTVFYEFSPFHFLDADGTNRLTLVKNWNFTPNMSDFDIDRTDTGVPIFTKKSDILGTFNFDNVNTIDFFETGSSTLPTTYAWWATQIALGKPTSVTFLATLRAPNREGDKVGKVQYIGRIMSVPLDRVDETGVHTFQGNGDITKITSIRRTES